LLRYEREARPRLNASDRAWARQRLDAEGLRKQR
jgi:hypothetical protein